MALATYSDLQTAIVNYLIRSDLTSYIPDFISLAEAYFNRVIRNLRMETSTNLTLVPSNAYVSLPSDFISTRSVLITDGVSKVLSQLPLQTLNSRFASTDTGKPDYYAITGTSSGRQLKFAKVPDAAYTAELVYLQKIPALSVSNTTNWLLTDHPDIYLFGTLLQAEPFIHNDQRVALWAQALQAALNSLDEQNRAAVMSSAGSVAEPDFYTP